MLVAILLSFLSARQADAFDGRLQALNAEVKDRSAATLRMPRPAATLCQEHLERGRLTSSRVYDDAMRAALTEASALSPEDAGERLSFLQIRKQVPAHLGVSLLLALRSQELTLEDAVYCHDPSGKQSPSKWIGASTVGGDFWRIDLSGAGEGRGILVERRRNGKALSQAASRSLEGFVSCAPDLPDINGVMGLALRSVRGKDYQPWRHTPECETVLEKKFDIRSTGKAPSAPASAKAIAGRSAHWGASRNTTGSCYEYALYALEDSGVIRGRKAGQDWRSFYSSISLDYLSAKNFGRWGTANPKAMERVFGLGKIPTPADPKTIPAGAVIVYEPGTCGFSAKHGHIEIAQGDGTACSDHCQALYPYCFAKQSSQIAVFVSTR